MTEQGNRTCRKCLLRDMQEKTAGELLGQIREWIQSIPAEYQTEEQVAQRRLDVCRMCRHLVDGTCQLCGCYVEYRAAHRLRDCPDLPDQWAEC